eukprot:3634341-Rhodomonas_salina.4
MKRIEQRTARSCMARPGSFISPTASQPRCMSWPISSYPQQSCFVMRFWSGGMGVGREARWLWSKRGSTREVDVPHVFQTPRVHRQNSELELAEDEGTPDDKCGLCLAGRRKIRTRWTSRSWSCARMGSTARFAFPSSRSRSPPLSRSARLSHVRK